MLRSYEQMLERKPLHPAEAQAPAATFCVIGATGYIGSAIAARLLAAGHTVHGTTISSAGAEFVVMAMNELPDASQRLRWFYADMLQPGSFDEAMAGCKYVIHTACAVDFRAPVKLAYEKFISPALRGVTNVLDSATRAGTVERVVMTSSQRAVVGSSRPGHIFSDSDWNLEFGKTNAPYDTAKMVSEWYAWSLAGMQKQWKLVTICPALVYGPPLVPNKQNPNATGVSSLLDGKSYPHIPPLGMVFSDIDDVAATHTLAAVVPGASGRYLVSERGMRLTDIALAMREHYPGHPIPYKPLPLWMWRAMLWLEAWRTGNRFLYEGERTLIHESTMDCSKVKRELGLDITPMQKTVGDLVERLKVQGWLEPLPAQ